MSTLSTDKTVEYGKLKHKTFLYGMNSTDCATLPRLTSLFETTKSNLQCFKSRYVQLITITLYKFLIFK